MRLGLIAFGVLLSACATAPADGPGQASATAEAKKTCKRTTVIGSNMPQNVCHTEEEWAELEKRGRDDVEEFDRQRRQTSPLGN